MEKTEPGKQVEEHGEEQEDQQSQGEGGGSDGLCPVCRGVPDHRHR